MWRVVSSPQLKELTAEQLSRLLRCWLAGNSSYPRETWKLFLTRASAGLDQALDLLSSMVQTGYTVSDISLLQTTYISDTDHIYLWYRPHISLIQTTYISATDHIYLWYRPHISLTQTTICSNDLPNMFCSRLSLLLSLCSLLSPRTWAWLVRQYRRRWTWLERWECPCWARISWETVMSSWGGSQGVWGSSCRQHQEGSSTASPAGTSAAPPTSTCRSPVGTQ